MTIKTVALTVLMSAVLVSGCAQQGAPMANDAYANGATGMGNNPYGNGGNASNTYGYGANNGGPAYGNGAAGQYTPDDLRNPASILSQRVIYFDYDSSNIKPEYLNVLNAHASLLAAYPNLQVRLEGHADERGSREYNVALSERRGYAVLDYMLVKGAKTNQMDVIGYGEEIPTDFGHNEAAWGKNRRVEIKYAGE